MIAERHRHRYEVNNAYRQQLVEAGLVDQRHVPGGPARRDHRAARPPVVRRLAVPPRVQVAADAAGAALPRVRRGGARAVARRRAARRASRSLSVRCAPEVLDLFLELAASRARRARSAPSPIACIRYLRDCGLDGRRGRHRAARSARRWATSSSRLEPTAAGEPLFLCAHLDTVPPTAAIEPVVEDGIVRNAAGDDPRRRQQGGGRGHARGDAPRARREPPARRDRARSSRRRRRSA